ncbi:MAG: serine/threonine-protein phosphatase [Candidatus Eremiobacteraeota bacterium]|nr:serine/threonine-protein phosphatase [Candidatus Eremiobacteraeota bacterium]
MQSTWRAAYRAVVTYLDRLLDRLVVFRPSHRSAPFWKAMIAVSLLLAFLSRSLYGHVLSVDLFLLPVLLAAALFRNRGMLVIPLAAAAYCLGGLLCSGIDNRHLFLNTLGQTVEWVLLAGFGLVTLDRYGAIKRLQARMAGDVELARRLQLALMQNRFELGTVALRGKVNQTLEVGGDFYYFRPFGQKYVVFCLGDVMGKGISASLLMALVMGFMFEWGKKSPSPSFVLRKLNQRLIQWNQEQSTFVTMFYAVYDEEEGRLHFANAGHPAGLLLRGDGSVDELEGTGIPLGVMDDSEWGENQTSIAPGERLLMYSDGLLEARNENGEDYGMERLTASLRATQKLPLEKALERVESDVRRFCQGRLSDDLAILVMERS